jgi:D-beta-D-heptose 7-phosphate kinase/D-beta-D-heptose 1-phosphate adenosyltransferase
VIACALETARGAGAATVCDPKLRNFFAYVGATVFKPNARELARAFDREVRAGDPSWMEAARSRLRCENLLVTLGEAGLALQRRDGTLLRVPTAARDVYDVSGAGDTVAAALAVALACGASVTEAALLANHAAGVEVGKAGVATVSPQELTEHARYLHEEFAG